MSRRDYNFYVYIMASSSGTLYIGMTNNLIRRVSEHKEKKAEGFSKEYSCNKLVFYEHHKYVYNAIEREKEIKKWRREKKHDLIKMTNPHWNDTKSYFDCFIQILIEKIFNEKSKIITFVISNGERNRFSINHRNK